MILTNRHWSDGHRDYYVYLWTSPTGQVCIEIKSRLPGEIFHTEHFKSETGWIDSRRLKATLVALECPPYIISAVLSRFGG